MTLTHTKERHGFRNQVLVKAMFSPGFSSDLTSWKTVICFDGKLIQTINWFEMCHERASPEQLHSQLTEQELDAVTLALEAINGIEIQAMKRHVSIDDAPSVWIVSPEFKLDVSISPWAFAFMLNEIPNSDFKQALPDSELQGVLSFQRAWELIESVSPYTTGQHWA